MAFQIESNVTTGTSIPYHITSRARLPIITGDALRAAAVRLPPGDLRQFGKPTIRGNLRLTNEARAYLPPIMGGSSAEATFDASMASRIILKMAASQCPARRDLGATLHLNSMGFADDQVEARPPLRMADLGDADADGHEGPGAARPAAPPRQRDARGRFGGRSLPDGTRHEGR